MTLSDKTARELVEAAKRLFRAESPLPDPLLPWARAAQFDDLWPSEQERYRKLVLASAVHEMGDAS